MYSDDKIIEGIIRGDVMAYEMLFLRYYVVVMRFICKLIKNPQLAEDTAQDIFLKIWQGRHCLDSKRSIKGLLYSMAKNASINILKSKNSNQVRIDSLSPEISWGGVCNTVEEDMNALELNSMVIKNLEKLPPQCRRIFVMSRYRNMSNDEIAAYLNISKRTVEVQISNALKELRNQLNVS